MTPDGWIQGCRCGRMVTIAISRRETAEKVDQEIKKRWYDADGNLERVTGNGTKGPEKANNSPQSIKHEI